MWYGLEVRDLMPIFEKIDQDLSIVEPLPSEKNGWDASSEEKTE